MTAFKSTSIRMKVLFFRHSLLNRGGDKIVVDYANYLHDAGHDVVIQTNVKDTIFNLHVRTEAISQVRGKLFTIGAALAGKRGEDIILADIIMMVFLLSLRNKKRMVYLAQDDNESFYTSPFMKLIIKAAYFYCLTILKIPVIAVSDHLGQVLKKKYKAQVYVVPNGVNTDEYYFDQDSNYMKLKGFSKVILVFIRHERRKGVDICRRVLSALGPDIEQGRISVWAVGERFQACFPVKNFGFVPPAILRKILSCSDVLFYPSRYEGFGLFVLEAMACGCAVVTTKAVPIAVQGDAALLCDIGDINQCTDLLRNVLIDDSLRMNMIARGLEEAKKHSIACSRELFERCLHLVRHRNDV